MSTLLDHTLLLTKITVPLAKGRAVRRPRLIRSIETSLRGKLTAVCAPAGSGKTTVLSQWARESGRPAAWVSLDETDNDPGKFWRYAVHALAGAMPSGSLTRVLPLAHALAGISVHTFLDALLNELLAFGQPIDLIFDDYQVIREARIHQGMEYFIEYLPPNVHVLIASRSELPLPAGRWTARGELSEIGAPQLNFTLEETEQFCAKTDGIPLQPRLLNRLHAYTEGWVTGLQLALVSLPAYPNPERFIEDFKGHRSLSGFLFEEVFGKLPRDIQSFLLDTAVLDRMDASLGDEVSGRTDSRDMLGKLAAYNLFLIPLDDADEWFRYHHLFGQFLRAMLARENPERRFELHRRASRSLADRGLMGEAIDHAIEARDFAYAETLLERHIPTAFMQGEYPTLLRWFEALPEDDGRSPDLTLLYAYLLSAGGIPERAMRELDRVRRRYESERDEETRARLQSGMLFVQSNLLFFSGDFERWHVFAASHADRKLPSNRTFYSFNYNLTEPFVRRTALGLKGVLNPHTEAIGLSFVRVVESQGWQESYINLYVRQSLCEGYYEWNRLEDCKANLAAIEQTVNLGKVPGLLFPMRLMQARLYLLEGKAHLAHVTVDEAAEYAGTLAEPHWSQFLRAFKALIYLSEDETAPARKLISSLRISEKDKPTLSREIEYLALVRLLIKQKKHTPALRLLELLKLQSRRENLLSSLAEISILQATAEYRRGHRSAALRFLHEALTIGEANGYVRSFLDEGKGMEDLLRSYLAQRKREAGAPLWEGVSEAYVQRLIGVFPQSGADAAAPPDASLVEPLSESETAMLEMVRAGSSNGEIARELALSEGTVKVYLSRLYAKLGVSSRTQAVSKAKELRILE
ncbi:LuxR C-terminal-related transcriptional regulator [Cohnella caldifontis]|uniref:LuxR C-terminal-related transcriptional regulator n=1 Tax=Cohnella caldifontis TaxID=3027471 RepID=UPI0023EAE36F|nr:LuxR C-terminal-related transcriptional regulator [Cohnella sp. YIM B05605]